MYRYDPIMSSSPPRSRPQSDNGDELASQFVTQPTQPLNATRSSYFPDVAMPHTTQPTQLLSPQTNRTYNPAYSQVQVVRSSPVADRGSSPAAMYNSQSQRQFVNAMAPPGTSWRLPQPVPRPMPIEIPSDDPPAEPDSEEEEAYRGSNIAPSKIETQSRTSTSRVEETPQKPSFDMSSYAYAAQPRKRAADTSVPSDVPQKKAKPLPRQSGPSRAMPVDLDEELTIEDIPDHMMRTKAQRIRIIFPCKTIKQIYDALLKKKGHYDDAVSYLAEIESDDESLRTPPALRAFRESPQHAVEPKKTAQRVVNAPTKSLGQRYSKVQQAYNTPSATESPEQPKKRGRLMRGRRNRTPSPQPSPPRSRPQKKHVLPESGDEAIEILSDSDSAAEAQEEEAVANRSLLDFFNTCSVEAMADLSGHKEDEIREVFEKRPFGSLDAVEKIHVDSQKTAKTNKKTRKPKVTFGHRLVESASAMWGAYEGIDTVVQQCAERGRPMVTAMARWGINISGASTEGEVAVISLDENSDTGSNRDSGYQSPRSTRGSDSDGEGVREISQRTFLSKQKLLKKPSIMNDDIELKDYQVVGLNWLNLLYTHKISGILADDMGLGKTCQVIAFLSHLKETGKAGPHLIIVPGSTLENWAREFEHFSKQINIEVYYGRQPERIAKQEDILYSIEKGEIDVVLTTYDLAFKKEDNYFLRKCNPEMCIFDEGHVLRNANTQRYKALMKIKARCRLLLTGTPLQNSLQELLSILAFLMPDIFADENISEWIAVAFKHKAKVTESDTHDALLSTQRINRARQMMTPFILRRKKAQVLQHLPKKTCRVEYCELTPTQEKLYSEQLEKQRKVLEDRANGIQSQDHANVMMKLRQAAIHPLLFRERYTEDKIRKMAKACLREEQFSNSDPDIIYEELQLYQDYQCHQLALKYPKALGRFELKNNEWMDSGKVTKLVELLKKFKENGDRTLVFSQFTSVMDILQWVLDDLDIGYFRLDGQTPIDQRQQMLDEFYNDESIPVFMLSTKSGGAGINLACANKVIIFDSSFNPQDDIQAENRAHRVGQTREVEVVRLVTKGTVEEQIHALGISKLELDKLVSGEEVAEGSKKRNKLSAAEEVGIEAVEKMMMAQLVDGEKVDVKEQFMDGLKKAGLDMSAA